MKTFEGHDEDVKCLAISSDDNFLFSGSLDNSVIQWNIDDATVKQKFIYDSSILCIALSPDDRVLISGSQDSQILVWDV